MSKSVKTTQIEKKTKSGAVIKLDYAKVVDRLNEFRSSNPRSKVMTNHKVLEGGNVVFKAYIWKDKTDFIELLKTGVDQATAILSADSEGTSEFAKDSEKKFEKLETIAVGRALALLGYAGSGEVASSEEMEEFENFKLEQKREVILSAITSLESAKTINALKDIWQGLTAELRANADVLDAKNKRKAALDENN